MLALIHVCIGFFWAARRSAAQHAGDIQYFFADMQDSQHSTLAL